jgi:hypothetical protein
VKYTVQNLVQLKIIEQKNNIERTRRKKHLKNYKINFKVPCFRAEIKFSAEDILLACKCTVQSPDRRTNFQPGPGPKPDPNPDPDQLQVWG